MLHRSPRRLEVSGGTGRYSTVGKLAEALVKAQLKNIADELMCKDTNQVRLLKITVQTERLIFFNEA